MITTTGAPGSGDSWVLTSKPPKMPVPLPRRVTFSGTLISIPPKIDTVLITSSRCSKTASVRSISTPPKSATALVRRPTRQRPLRDEPPKTATRFCPASVESGLS